jgi:hypothetical protein
MNAPRRCPTPRSAVGLLLAVALLLSSLVLPARTQAEGGVNTSLWVANGNVIDVALSGTTLYLGGAFTYVGPLTGGFAALDAGSGAPNLALPPTNGTVRVVVPDGSGGWYIGGEFTTVGGYPRNRLAHLKADGELDFRWDPSASGGVRALAMDGSTVYAGGFFTTIGGQARNYIAALDATSGEATA